jgi:5'-deoxynucleotidase YfbR-like HD superfamily hydrolase
MDIMENLVIMKRLLRQGWVRAGVPVGSIESLAAHSWAVAFLAFTFCLEENQIRSKNPLNLEKTVLIALLHDFPESEWLDMDKSVSTILAPEQFEKIQLELNKAATNSLLSKFSSSIRGIVEQFLLDTESDEYHLARVADLMDLLLQTNDYSKKKFLDQDQRRDFQGHARKQLGQYTTRFRFLKALLESGKI